MSGASTGGNGGLDHGLDGDDLARLGERSALGVGRVDDLGVPYTGRVTAARRDVGVQRAQQIDRLGRQPELARRHHADREHSPSSSPDSVDRGSASSRPTRP